MAIHLLDVNVLLALFDPYHSQHIDAHSWFEQHVEGGWATCPLTENGFVRISSSPTYPTQPGNAAEVTTRLERFCGDPNHVFWPADVRIGELLNPHSLVLHKHVTDLYLVGLARHHGGKLATFDRRIPANLIAGQGAVTLIPLSGS